MGIARMTLTCGVLACAAFLPASARAAIPASERAALVELYNRTNGPAWFASTNWNGPPGTECTWHGVGCDSSQSHVVTLALQDNNLQGTLPSLDGLPALQVVFLHTNRLSGPIPPLAGLTDLRQVEIGINQLSGPIPSLQGLPSLTAFGASRNELSGTIPTLSGLTALQVFNVDINRITGTIPSLAGLRSLLSFHASDNELEGSIPSLDALVALNDFSAARNRLTGAIPPLQGAAQLVIFHVSGNRLTGGIPSLAGLSRLTLFAAGENQLTGPLPDLSAVPALTLFSATNNRLSGSITALAPRLETFEVSGNLLSGPVPALRDIPLRLFGVADNDLSGPMPEAPATLFAGVSNLCRNRLFSSGNSETDAAWTRAQFRNVTNPASRLGVANGDWLSCQKANIAGEMQLVGSSDLPLTFRCSGRGICRGTYRAQVAASGCSNSLAWSGEFGIGGVDLSSTGPISGFVSLDFFPDASVFSSPTRNSDGTCVYAELRRTQHPLPYTGTWDGQKGRINLSSWPLSRPAQPPALTFSVDFGPPAFAMSVDAQVDSRTAYASATIQFPSSTVGTQGSVYVFALAPQDRVRPGAGEPFKVGHVKGSEAKDMPIACVLAQLNAAGQMVAVSSDNLAAYLTGVLSAQGAAVTILNGVPTGNVSGGTFFVGHGSSGTAMINSGANRAVVTVPGSTVCEPVGPQTGWWWNPLEDGRGFSIEKYGVNLFFASFLYDVSGRSTWYVSSGRSTLEGSLYNGDLLRASGGQTLGGPYQRFPTLASAGTVTLTFHNESNGTMVWPGGTVPIQRFNIIPNGLAAPAASGVPESGWWWNESEAGRGFFLEFQGPWLDIAGYMYDDNGNSVWYLTVGEIGGTETARTFNGTWWSYTGGQTLTGAWRQNTRSNSNVAPMTITFSGRDTALMTLPNGRTTALRRHRF